MGRPIGLLAGYRQVEIIFIPLGLFRNTYISQISVGCFLVPVICIAAKVPSAIPSSFLSGLRKTRKTLCSERRYCRIFILECLVQKYFGLSDNFNIEINRKFIDRIFVYKNEGEDENFVFIAEDRAKIFFRKYLFQMFQFRNI